MADCRHDLGFGEDLGVGTDSDLEILRPGALLHQHLLQFHRLRRTGPELRQITADQAADGGADFSGGGRIAAGPFLDDAFEHRGGEGDAAGFQRLQIDGGQQPGLRGIAGFGRRVGHDGVNATEARPGDGTGGLGRIIGLAEIAHRREGGGDVDQTAAIAADD